MIKNRSIDAMKRWILYRSKLLGVRSDILGKRRQTTELPDTRWEQNIATTCSHTDNTET